MMYIPEIGILFCFLVVSKALDHCKEKCEAFTINASLESEVILPCIFNTSLGNNTVNKTDRARWRHFDSLLEITQDGNIVFGDPREGRVTVYPLLAAGGNFSIIIRNLQSSDLGTYCCELNWECWRVKITQLADKNEFNPWLYFAAGAGLFILLFIAFYLFSKIRGNYVTRSSKPTSVNGVQSEDNHTRETQNTERNEQRNRNRRGHNRRNATVYENEAYAQNQVTSVQQGQNPQRAFRPVPEPTTSQQQSSPKPYYVNHAELSIPGNADKKRKKQKKHYHFKNPIYGD